MSNDKNKNQPSSKITPSDAIMLDVMGIMERRKGRFEDLLPPWMPAERFVAGAKMALSLNADLLKCTPESILLSLLKAARAGIDVSGGFLGHGALVPYKTECTFQPMYKGLVALAIVSGVVRDMTPLVVYSNDHFVPREGSEGIIEHIPFVPRKLGDKRGDIIAAYTRVKLPSGENVVKGLLYLDDIQRVKNSVKFPDGPWKSWESEMIKKTTVKNACKTIGTPSSDQAQYMAAALQADNEASGFDVEGDVISSTPAQQPPTKGTARLKELAAASKGEQIEHGIQEPPEGVPLPTMEPGSNG